MSDESKLDVHDFGHKRVDEVVSLSFDFQNRMASTESLSTASDWVATVKTGTDASPGDIISGSASISGTKSVQKITGGTDGVVYYLAGKVTTDAGQTLEGIGIIEVDDQES